MYAKLKNGSIDKYPYSFENLKQDNPNTSFPHQILQSTLEEFDLVTVVVTGKPEADSTKNVVETTPVYNKTKKRWETSWEVVDATVEEIQARLDKAVAEQDALRLQAYRNESDPLFFKWQRGEATQQEWLDKIQEIKERY